MSCRPAPAVGTHGERVGGFKLTHLYQNLVVYITRRSMAMPLHDGVTPDTPSAKSPGRRERTERLRSRALAQVFNYTSSKSPAEMHEGISTTGLGR